MHHILVHFWIPHFRLVAQLRTRVVLNSVTCKHVLFGAILAVYAQGAICIGEVVSVRVREHRPN